MYSEELEKYQQFAELTIRHLSQQITTLEKKLDMFSYLLEISIYINQNLKDPNLYSLINDMLIGVFGAKQSSIYIKMEEMYQSAAQKSLDAADQDEIRLILEKKEEEFIINSDVPIFDNQRDFDIHSCMGVPVKLDNRLIAFILIQHQEMNYFTKEHVLFLSLIGNHIGVAIENNFLYKQIMDHANKDGLTDLFNKRYFYETLYQLPNIEELDYSLVIVDLDRFKQINDKYGHMFGDVALRTVAQILRKTIRSNDIIARYGGDEFIIFLMNFTDREKVFKRVDAIREEIEKTVIKYDNDSLSVTASFGIYIKYKEHLTLEEVIRRADSNMYQGKLGGRNKVVIS